MNDDFVPFESAVKLKEKDYPQIVSVRYDEQGELYIGDDDYPVCAAPTIPQVLKWLRKEKFIDVVIYPIDASTLYMGGEKYILSIYINSKRDYKPHHDGFDKYVEWEQAALAGIEYVLDNLI